MRYHPLILSLLRKCGHTTLRWKRAVIDEEWGKFEFSPMLLVAAPTVELHYKLNNDLSDLN